MNLPKKLKLILTLGFILLLFASSVSKTNAMLCEIPASGPCASDNDCLPDFGSGYFCKAGECCISGYNLNNYWFEEPSPQEWSQDIRTEDPNKPIMDFDRFTRSIIGRTILSVDDVLVGEMISSDSCIDIDPLQPQVTCSSDTECQEKYGFDFKCKQGKCCYLTELTGVSYKPNGAIGSAINLVTSLYKNPPASGIDYLADLGSNLGLVKPAYAQGLGFMGMRNLLPLWKVFRDAAYLMFILLFVAVGLAVMFRVKISPQTIISIESAIPGMVVALVLITFSYAIAGFLIDIIYVIITLGVWILGRSGMLGDQASVAAHQARYLSLSFGEAVGTLLESGLHGIAAVIGNSLDDLFGFLTVIFAVVGSPLLLAIFAIVALISIIKLFFSLLLSYIGIILKIILAPVIILFGVIPGVGVGGGFNTWIVDMFADIMVFPAVALFLLFDRILMVASRQPGTAPYWIPPVLGSSPDTIPAYIGFAMILLAPKVPDMVKQMIKPKAKPSTLGKDISEAIGAPGRMVGTGVGALHGAAGLVKSGVQVGLISSQMPTGRKDVGGNLIYKDTTAIDMVNNLWRRIKRGRGTTGTGGGIGAG